MSGYKLRYSDYPGTDTGPPDPGGPYLPLTGGTVGYITIAAGIQNAFYLTTSNATDAGQQVGFNAQSTNTGSNPAIAHKFTYFSSANAGDFAFDIGLASLAIYDPNPWVSSGQSYDGAWIVCVTPNDATHSWAGVNTEFNIVNRGPDMGWARDRQLLRNTGALLVVPEVAIFGGGGGGEGKNATYAVTVAHSGGNNSTGFPAKFYNGLLIEPNSIVGLTGRGSYMTGDITGTSSQYPYGPFQTDGTWLHGFDHTLAVYQDNNAQVMLAGQGVAWLTGTTGTPTNICRDTAGNGSPEGVVTANKGSTYRRFDGGAASCFYVKESGTGNTGWVAK